MLSIDLNEISAITDSSGSQMERVYVGSDLVWTESEPLKLIIEDADKNIYAFDLKEIDEIYDELNPRFSISYSNSTFSDFFKDKFGVRYVEDGPKITKIRDNQSTDDYGILGVGSIIKLSDLTEVILPKV